MSDPIMMKREQTRTWLAYGITGLVGAVAVTLTIWGLVRNSPLTALLTGVFTPLIGIAGTVIGFYFAEEKQQQTSCKACRESRYLVCARHSGARIWVNCGNCPLRPSTRRVTTCMSHTRQRISIRMDNVLNSADRIL